jgi:hypothetical protein
LDLTARRGAPQPASHAVPKPAAALHDRRVQSAHVIDLREGGAIQLGATISTHPMPPATHPPTHSHAAMPNTAAHERHLQRFSDRFERARVHSRSEAISKFGTDRFGNIQDPEKMYDKFGNPTLATLTSQNSTAAATTAHHDSPHHSPLAPGSDLPEMPHLAATQHEAMTNLPKPLPPATPAISGIQNTWRPNLKLSPHRNTMATVAAIAIMASYIWLQNYPKLAIQSAGDKAGIAATLPGYLPSSYILDHTDSTPGLVTLNFTSPSISDTLKIEQHRTTWDNGSLLDNFVAKNADDYGTVQGQGLTIYLFNNNQATWVNHGIWYSIEGASRLSREQILKIAYSL